MGTILEKSGIAAKMLENMAKAFRSIKGGLSISIIIVGALLAVYTENITHSCPAYYDFNWDSLHIN